MLNFYEAAKVKKHIKKAENPSFENTHIALNSRTLVVGGSGTGKTNFVANYLKLSPNTYNKVVICNKSLEEPIYEWLREELKGHIVFYTLETLPSLTEMTKTIKNEGEETLVIFDDIVADLPTKSPVNLYFTAGRKCRMTMMFLTQSYYKVPKIIRGQLNYLVLLKLSSDKDQKMVLSDYSLGVDKNELVELYRDATKTKFNFLKVDIHSTDEDKKFAKNFLGYYRTEGGDDGGDNEMEVDA